MPIQCDHCKMYVPNFNCLAQHYINVHHGRYEATTIGKCTVCISMNPKNINKLKRYANQEELDRHILMVHKRPEERTVESEVKVSCKFCEETFNYYPDLAEHYRRAHERHDIAQYVGICDICAMTLMVGYQGDNFTPDKVYASYNQLKAHWKSVHGNGMPAETRQLLEQNQLQLSRK